MTDSEQAREMVLAGICPLCGIAGWTSLSIHLAKKHGVRVRDFKASIGIPWSHNIDSPELRQWQAERARELNLVEDLRRNPAKHRFLVSAPGRKGKGQSATISAPKRRKIPLDDLPKLAARVADGERLADLARPYGASASALCLALKKWRTQ